MKDDAVERVYLLPFLLMRGETELMNLLFTCLNLGEDFPGLLVDSMHPFSVSTCTVWSCT